MPVYAISLYPFYESTRSFLITRHPKTWESRNKNGNSMNIITYLKNLTELEIYVDLEIISSILDDEEEEHNHGHRGLFPGPP
jgi:hypothetical protein